MKKILSIILSICMVFSMGTAMTACDKSGTSTSSTQEQTNEEKVRDRVEMKGRLYFLGYSIGGKELKSSRVNITYLYFNSDETECYVSGRITATTIYDTTYSNYFDCEVKTSDGGETWEISSFEVTDQYWSRG